MAAALTTPLDVVKTRLQLEGVSSRVSYRAINLVSHPHDVSVESAGMKVLLLAVRSMCHRVSHVA